MGSIINFTSPVGSASASTITFNHQGVTVMTTSPGYSHNFTTTITTNSPYSRQQGFTITTTTLQPVPPARAIPTTYTLKTHHNLPLNQVPSLHGKVKNMQFFQYLDIKDCYKPRGTLSWTKVVAEFDVPERWMYWAMQEAEKLPGFVRRELPPSWESSPYCKPEDDSFESSRFTELP